MAYSFLPQLDGNDYRDPPTPVSLPSPSSTIHANEFFENYVDNTLRHSSQPGSSTTPPKTHHAPILPLSSSQSTPTIARTLASTSIAPADIESPDPLGMSGPSPSKKARFGPTVSPPRTHSGLKINLKVGQPSSSTNTLPVTERPVVRRLTPEVVINLKRKSVSPKKARVEEAESSGDELDWGDEAGVDQEGDFRMSDPAFTSPSPTKRVEPKGSGRTGERDQRCKSTRLYWRNNN
jgi:hypothetical protein